MGYRQRLMPFGPRFDLATLVVVSGLGAVLVADMHFNAGQEVIKTLQALAYGGLDPGLKTGAALDVVAVDVNLHGIPHLHRV